MLAYALSFALAAVSRGGVAVPGYLCAYWTLSRPLMVPAFFEKRTAEAIPFLISGWINVLFLAAVAIRWRSGNGPTFRILRTTTLAMIPFCWIVFFYEHLHLREGHVLWIVGMVLALFSGTSSSRSSS